MGTGSGKRRRKRRGALHKIRITDLAKARGPKGEPMTLVSFEVIPSDRARIKRGAFYKPGAPPAYVKKGSTGLVLLDDAHIAAAPTAPAPDHPTAESFNYLTIWLWTKIADAPGLPPSGDPAGEKPPPSAGPAERPKPPNLGGGGSAPGVIIVGPGGVGGGGGGPSDPHEIAESICEEAGAPGSVEFEECVAAFLDPDLEPSGSDTDDETDTGGADTGDTGDVGDGFVGW